MNKAIFLPIQPKWMRMILSDKKQYEFRGSNVKNFEIGMKVYLYESFGKKIKCVKNYEKCSKCEWCLKGSNYTCTIEEKDDLHGGRLGYAYKQEGIGKVVGECVIEEVYEVNFNESYIFDINETLQSDKKGKFNLIYQFNKLLFMTSPLRLKREDYITAFNNTKNKLKDMGHTNQPYAIKLKDVVEYDEPIDKSEFIGYNTNKLILNAPQSFMYCLERDYKEKK